MKRFSKVFSLLLIMTLLMVLVACGKSLKLPKPKGKAVTLTQEQYDEKLKTLKVIDTGFAELES